MRTRKYLIVFALAWACILVWTAYWVWEEQSRLAASEKKLLAEDTERGLDVFAKNCVSCHGPVGEGHIGPPLNREAFRGDPATDVDTYNLLYTTIANGRPGSTSPRWVKVRVQDERTGRTDWRWASYTAMPTWGVQNGGPLNEQQLRAVVTFIMNGDWKEVSAHVPAPELSEEQKRKDPKELMPDASGISPAASARGKDLFVQKGCAGCHRIGDYGGLIGPDLTKIGSWGVDAEFLDDWIRDPQGMSKAQKRAPVYWSNYAGPLPFARDADASQAEGNPAGGGGQPSNITDIPLPNPLELPDTIMPAIPMTDEERAALVEYLIHLE